MSSEQIWLAAGGALALVLLVVVLVLTTVVRRLAARVAVLEAAVRTAPAPAAERAFRSTEPPTSYVITAVEDGADRADRAGATADREVAATPGVVQGRIDGVLFADIVAREGVIKAAGLVHGVRRALDPETRNRIRFEMKREVKRSRRQRRADLKAALRDLQARERADQAGRRDGEDAA